MEAMEAILTRRSIRKYEARLVDESIQRELLNAAMNAPSSSNGQPYFHPYSKMVKEAPMAVFVCGDLQLEKGKGVWVQDCSAATENLLIAANARGLGAVWLGVYPIEERIIGSRRLPGLPDHIIPLCIVVIGYPAKKSLQLIGLIQRGFIGTNGNK